MGVEVVEEVVAVAVVWEVVERGVLVGECDGAGAGEGGAAG